MLCYGSRGFAIGPGPFGVMLWYGSWCDTLTYDYVCVRGCTEIWNLLVLCCVWRQRRSGDHVPKRLHDFVCIMYTYMILIRILTYRFVPHLVIWFAFGLDPYFCTPCFTCSVHISYWPPFFGGCVLCPQVQTLVIPHCRLHFSAISEYSYLIRSPLLVQTSFAVYILYIWLFGYGGALSRHTVLSVSLEVCGQGWGLWSLCIVMWTCRWTIPIYRGVQSACFD